MLNFSAPPFERLDFVPADGQGLNPLLQNPAMIMHPPNLYAGFVGFTVPYAFAMAALLSGRTGATWVRLSRRWTLIAWMFLGLGMLLGGWWAYNELGWGGYWAWDPVENASLMPWLIGTAFLHSVMVQEQRGMFKVWNMLLIILAFVLSIFGTFLTRSGILDSIHAFAVSSIGVYFLVFISITLLGSFMLLYDRLPLLKSEHELDAPLSREAAFLLNNILFLGIWFTVFWGTMYPIISELVTGRRIFVGPPFFNMVAGPLLLVMLVLMGIGPLLPWRRTSWTHAKRHMVPPLIFAFVLMGVLWLVGVRRGVVVVAYGVVTFATAGHLLEFWRGWRAQRERSGAHPVAAFFELIAKNRRRYGGYIVHLGVLLLTIGVIGSKFYEQVVDITLAPGERTHVGGYTVQFLAAEGSRDLVKERVAAPLHIWKGERFLGTLTPSLDYYFKVPGGQRETEVAVRSSLFEDFYVVLTGVNRDGSATFKIFVNPLVAWVWIGGLLLLFGTWVAMWPDPREERILERLRAREVSRRSLLSSSRA
ncbi:MAG: cytochrome c-type biogenesis CcmF C-terminal domain-containing protein [Ardenticatenia bacterium]|nr:cytochrome c-type biogenesis CcmF C-terminal domain-containing protein [Ardenticatenia bacterium]